MERNVMIDIRERIEQSPHLGFRAWVDLALADEKLSSKILVGLYETEVQARHAAERIAKEIRQAYQDQTRSS